MAKAISVGKALQIVPKGKFLNVVEHLRNGFKVLRTLQIVSGALADTLPRLIKVWLGVTTDLSEPSMIPEIEEDEV